MFRNYFKIAWRNIIKDRLFTILNVVGLATGLACALLIWLWVSEERHMEKFNEKDAQLYQVMQRLHLEDGIQTTEYTPGPLASALASELPEVEHAVSVVPASWFSSKGIVSIGNNRLKAGGQFISKDYFNIFTCPFVEGDPQKIFSDKHFIAISDELSQKLFHSVNNVIGKTIEWSQNEFNGSYLITGIFKKNPGNATERFDMLFNFDLFVEKRPGMLRWGNSDPSTYVLLRKGTDISRFDARIENFVREKEKNSEKTFFARKFSDRYLYGQYKNGKQAGGRIAYVQLFTLIGLFILVIACINFMNLSTAKASRRIKEVGIKKVVGATRSVLVLQYLGESLLMSFLSLLFAIVLMAILLPAFNTITGKNLELDFSVPVIGAVLLITFVTGILAGSYPALYISGFKPSSVLKGKLISSGGEAWIRKGLVVFQFALSVFAIIAVLTVHKQLKYIQTKNLGYTRDNIIDFAIPLDMDSVKLVAAESFVHSLKNIPGVVSTGSYYHNLTGDHGGIGGFEWPGKNTTKDIVFANLEIGEGFLETVGIKIKEGRYFSKGSNMRHEIIFNESAIKNMGLKDPIGKTVKFWDQQREIVGIAEDFHFESLYSSVYPCFFQVFPVMPNVLVKIKAGTEQQTIEQIRKLYASFNEGLTFDFRFLDDEYQALYTSENRIGVLSKYFAGLAILISCLGLFGLAAFTAQRRKKEISIRKVVGASAARLTFMLSKDFLKLILIATVIAYPIVWWCMNSWLNNFAYRITIGAGVFIIAGFAIVLITLLTISFQSIRAALANPVKSLRTE